MTNSELDFLRYCGGHFENGDRKKFCDDGNQFRTHNLSTYEISLKSNNVEFVRYCGSHFENGDR